MEQTHLTGKHLTTYCNLLGVGNTREFETTLKFDKLTHAYSRMWQTKCTWLWGRLGPIESYVSHFGAISCLAFTIQRLQTIKTDTKSHTTSTQNILVNVRVFCDVAALTRVLYGF